MRRGATTTRAYTDCIRSCRAMRNAVADAVGAGHGEKVLHVVAERRGHNSEDRGYQFLQATWDALAKLTSEASHPRGRVFRRADARACLAISAALVEALTDLISEEDLA